VLLAAPLCFGAPSDPLADSQHLQTAVYACKLHLSFVVAGAHNHRRHLCDCFQLLLVYSVATFGKRGNDDGREPAQVYGSNQVELAWTMDTQ
jgi:hypothetical protein